MKIIHFSDTHLGHGDYSAIDSETGLNQREVDIYKVFREIIDYIIENRPDLVIHAGDLFDSVRPSNKAISVAYEQFYRLSKANIPLVVIAGNHSTPRQRTRETIFPIFDFIPNIHPVYGGKYKKIIINNCAIHAIPHTYSQLELQENILNIELDQECQYNILVTHGTAQDISEKSWIEFKDQIIPNSILEYEFDYVALGHFHSFQKIKDNVYYCGSPERLSFNETNQKKYFLEVELDTGNVKKIPTKPREMIDCQDIDCTDLTPEQIIESITSTVEGKIKEKILRLNFSNLPKRVYSSLDRQKIRELTKDATHLETKFNFITETATNDTVTSYIGSLSEEFGIFLQKQELNGEKLKEMKSLGMDYLDRVEEAATIE